jgi:hypothetical protein
VAGSSVGCEGMSRAVRPHLRRRLDRSTRRVIRRARRERLTYLESEALADLALVVREVERWALPGILVEAGCALGGSALVIAQAKAAPRPFFVHDVFGMIPAPSERDDEDVHERFRLIAAGESKGIRGDTYYGYRNDLKSEVEAAFVRFGLPLRANSIQLIQGRYEEKLWPDGPVAMAHIDCDWHDSVMVCLERIGPMLVPGGTLVIDDYETWSGARMAVDSFLSTRRDEYDVRRRARLHLVRRA